MWRARTRLGMTYVSNNRDFHWFCVKCPDVPKNVFETSKCPGLEKIFLFILTKSKTLLFTIKR